MKFILENQIFHLNEDIKLYHCCNGIYDITILEKIKQICTIALLDPVTIKHCFELDQDNPSTLLFQFLNKKMNIILIETNKASAILGYSLFEDIVFCPRRVFVDPALRGQTLFSKYVMPILEQMFIDLGMKYITMSFNKTKTGMSHFKLYTEKSNLRKVMTAGGYFTDFQPLSNQSIKMFGNQQFVVYKKLNNKLNFVPDLTIDKFLDQLK